jgi:hypothetical protein
LGNCFIGLSQPEVQIQVLAEQRQVFPRYQMKISFWIGFSLWVLAIFVAAMIQISR